MDNGVMMSRPRQSGFSRLKVLITVSIALIVGAAYWAIRQPAVLVLLLIVTGHAPDCTIREASLGAYRRLLYNDVLPRIERTSRYVAHEGPYRQVETPHGRFWEVVPKNGASETLAQVAEIESKYAHLAPAVHAGDVVLDGGANIGVFTRYALNHGARRVVAIEPAPDNLECLRRNVGGDSRVAIYPKGVWDKEEVLTLNESNATSAMDSFVATEDTHPGPRLALTTIDRLVDELKLPRVDFIKLDIEGAESRALRGAARTLARFHPRLELEATESPVLLTAVAREGWNGYTRHCLVCIVRSDLHQVRPSIIGLW
jgi:FkbM family methyltransferase